MKSASMRILSEPSSGGEAPEKRSVLLRNHARLPGSAERLIGLCKSGAALFYLICLLLVIAMARLTIYVDSAPLVAVPAADPAAALKAMDAFAGVNNLLTTLATGLLAGLSLFVVNRPKRHCCRANTWLALISALLVCLSLYWGYISQQNLEWAIESSVGTIGIEKLQTPRQLQCSLLLADVLVFADLVRRDLEKEASA